MVAAALPYVIMAGAAAASALGQWLNSSKAASASAEERARVQEIFSKLQRPGFDPSRLTPQEFQVVGALAPDVAPYIAEANPQLVSADSPDARMGRSVQKEALQRLLETSRAGGMGDQLLQAQMQQANLASAANAASQRSSIESRMARRGQLGSGMDYALQLAGSAQPQMQAAQAGQNQAMEAYRQKLQSLRGAADLGGQIRGEDVALSSQNSGIINAFNQRMAQSRRDAAMNEQNVRNDAQRYNLGTRQSAADRNVSLRNQYAVNERDRGDRLTQQDFDNQISLARGQAGLSDQRVSDILGNAQQSNQAIQAIGDLGIAGGAAWGRQQQYDADNEFRKNLWKQQYGTDYPTGGT